jgi:hypothetical protein
VARLRSVRIAAGLAIACALVGPATASAGNGTRCGRIEDPTPVRVTANAVRCPEALHIAHLAIRYGQYGRNPFRVRSGGKLWTCRVLKNHGSSINCDRGGAWVHLRPV